MIKFMVMLGQLNSLQKKEKDKFQKMSWRGRCALMVFFAATFVIAFFILIVWHYYKKINNVDLAAEIWNNNIETNNRELIETKDDPFWGDANGRIVITEFGDFECLFCRQMMPVLHELNLKYPRQIKFIYRDFLGNVNSQKAAEAAQCANEQEQFLIYHDKLFLNQENLNIDNLKIYAREVGIKNISKFDNCLDTDQFGLEVQQDYSEAQALGVKGTPTFFINGIKIEGVHSKEFFEQIIEYLLSLGLSRLPPVI